MKYKYLLITALAIFVFLGVVYYVIPKSPVAFEDMTPKLVELPEFEVTGFEIYGSLTTSDYPKAWQEIGDLKHKIDNCQNDFSYGIESYQKEVKSKWHYLAGCEMSDVANFANKDNIALTTRVIPKNNYVVFTYRGELTAKKMGMLYGYIFSKWLPKNGYRPAGYYNFERYGKAFLGAQSHRSELEVFVPIAKLPSQ